MAKITSSFMNYTKIQQDIIKATLSGDYLKYRFSTFQVDGYDRIAVTVNDCAMLFIPKAFWFLDLDSILKETQEALLNTRWAQDCYKGNPDNIWLTETGETVTVPGAKKIAKVLKNDEGEKIYIDQALTDLFKTAGEVKYKGTQARSAVNVYRDNDCLGLVLPIRINK